jgi:hypothetical protein
MEIIDFEFDEPIDLREIYSIGINRASDISAKRVSALPDSGFEIPVETEKDLRDYLRLGTRFG